MNPPIVYFVDDDDAVRESLALLLETAGHVCKGYGDAFSLLHDLPEDAAGCLVSDLKMPGMNGLELQAELTRRHVRLPMLFLTGHGDVPASVEAMRAGAEDFLLKPVNGQTLLRKVEALLAREAARREEETRLRHLRTRLEKLSPRERQILALALAGVPNKDLARQLELSHRTVEVHRSRIFLKLGVNNLLDVMQLGAALNLPVGTLIGWLEADSGQV